MSEEKTIIIKNEEEQKKGITFKIYLEAIKVFRYWILGISLLSAILGYLVMKLALNPIISSVKSTFNYSFSYDTFVDNIATLENGTKINLNQIISKENIEYVYDNTLDSDNKKVFASLSKDSIIDDADFSLEFENNNNNNNNNSTSTLENTNITLTSSVKPFNLKNDLATTFAKELIELTLTKVNDAYNSYTETNYLLNINNNSDFYTSCGLINYQYSHLYDVYSNLEQKYGSNTNISSLSATITELKNGYKNSYTVYDEVETTTLENLLYTKGYVNLGSTSVENKITDLTNEKESAEKRKELLEEEKTRLSEIIDAYKYVNLDELANKDSSIASQFQLYISSYEKTLASISDIDNRISLLTLQIDNLNNITDDFRKECESFKSSINRIVNKLNSSREQVNKVVRELFSVNYKPVVSYSSSTNVVIDGSISSVLIAGVALVLGFVVSSLSFCYPILNKNNSEKLNEKDNLGEEDNQKKENKTKTKKSN